MSSKKGSFFESRIFKSFMKYLYGIGAAVVIVGALFKILHLEGADIMLIVGLGTEALIFFISSFEPLHHELDWGKVYPQLNSDEDEFVDLKEESEMTVGQGLSMTDKMLKDTKISPDLFTSLSDSLSGLKTNVESLSKITDASVATSSYNTAVTEAAGKINQMNKSYSTTVEAMTQLSGAVNDAKAYHEQVQNVTRNLSSLNAVYELELQDAKAHLKSLNQFYGSLSSAMNNMLDASKDTESYKLEVAKLTKNLSALNTVYGNMLSAMNTGSAAK